MIKDKTQSVPGGSSPVYAFTGANGRLGRLVLGCLLEQVPANHILATTRQPERLADFAGRGVTVRRADFNEPATLAAAFSGATRLFIISADAYPMDKRSAQQRAAIEAAVAAGIRHIIIAAMPEAAEEDGTNLWTRGARQTMETMARSGVSWTALRMNVWMAGAPYFLNAFHQGEQLLVPESSGKPCWVAHEDYARTAVAVLTGKTPLTGSVDVTGPESLGLQDLARRWSELHQRKLDPLVLPDKEVLERLTANSMPLQQAQGMVRNCGLLRLFEMPVSNAVELATGIPPTPVDALLRDLILN